MGGMKLQVRSGVPNRHDLIEDMLQYAMVKHFGVISSGDWRMLLGEALDDVLDRGVRGRIPDESKKIVAKGMVESASWPTYYYAKKMHCRPGEEHVSFDDELYDGPLNDPS